MNPLPSPLAADWLLAPEPAQRSVARELYEGIAELPIISPHGHVDPRLLADEDAMFGTPAELFVIPDHYVFRMLYSQGFALESLGIRPRNASGRSPANLADARRQPPPVPRHAVRHLAGSRAARRLRRARAAGQRQRPGGLRRAER